ncbi:MAG: hypothetical protein UT91_C0017G0018 [Parcubacteria group bacterium GW2011_GWA2_40_23]|nr:MAG: hypothetical protein UT91_C0017G0018 [Parcubacteria group bacterium GW2011_GWA2_40_23]
MEDTTAPKSIGVNTLPPVYLTPEQENLCKRLDEWHKQGGLYNKPSDMFRGAVFAVRDECGNNPDFISQSANSLREILYPFQSWTVKKVVAKKVIALRNFGSVTVDEKFYNSKVEPLWKQLNDIAHHGVDPQWDKNFDFSTFSKVAFQKILADFEKVMNEALTRQLDVHQMIDEVLIARPQLTSDVVDKNN